MTILVGDPLRQVNVCRYILPLEVTQTGTKHGDGLAIISLIAREFDVLGTVLEVLAFPFE